MRIDDAVRKFNTTGPIVPSKNYNVPPLERIDLDFVLSLIHDEKYFILHAPRQTGKTSTLLALRDRLNSGTEGPYRCVYVNVESAQVAGEMSGEPCGRFSVGWPHSHGWLSRTTLWRAFARTS